MSYDDWKTTEPDLDPAPPSASERLAARMAETNMKRKRKGLPPKFTQDDYLAALEKLRKPLGI